MIEGNHSAWRAVRSVPKKVSFELSLKVKGNGLKEEMVGSMSGRGNPTARGKKTEMTMPLVVLNDSSKEPLLGLQGKVGGEAS